MNRPDFSTTVTVASAKCPGVHYVLYRPTNTRRGLLDSITNATRARSVRWAQECHAISLMPEETRDVIRVWQLNELIQAEVNREFVPITVGWGLKAVQGLTIDGEPLTVDKFIQDGPSELLTEVFHKISELKDLPDEPAMTALVLASALLN